MIPVINVFFVCFQKKLPDRSRFIDGIFVGMESILQRFIEFLERVRSERSVDCREDGSDRFAMSDYMDHWDRDNHHSEDDRKHPRCCRADFGMSDLNGVVSFACQMSFFIHKVETSENGLDEWGVALKGNRQNSEEKYDKTTDYFRDSQLLSEVADLRHGPNDDRA